MVRRCIQPVVRSFASIVLAALCLCAAGCSRSVAWLDRRDGRDERIKRARARQAAGDTDGAIELYRAALNERDRMARAHLDLALLLQHEKQDYFPALCHYQRYLDLRPDTEKRELIEGRMRRALQLWRAERQGGARPDEDEAAPLGDGQALARALQEARAARERARSVAQHVEELKERNRALRASVSRLEAETERLRHQSVPPPRAPRETPEPAEAPVARTYRVRRGDSLSSIAAEVYGDSRQWRRIYEANREKLGNSPEIKIGQVLTIP